MASEKFDFTATVAQMSLTGTRVDAALRALPGISATDLKKDFANVFRNLGPRGSIAVANHRQPRAVIVGVEEYIELLRLRESVLGSLEAEFDRRFAAMQTPEAARSRQKPPEAARSRHGRRPVVFRIAIGTGCHRSRGFRLASAPERRCLSRAKPS